MAHRDRDEYFTRSSAPLSCSKLQLAEDVQILDEEAFPDVDEPPENTITFQRLPIQSSTITGPLDPACCTPKVRHESLLTQSLLVAASSKPIICNTALRPKSAISSHSNESFASTAELTSDGGLTSPARTSTPSPPPPPVVVQTHNIENGQTGLFRESTRALAPVVRDGEERPRKRCITFACSRPQVELNQSAQAKASTEVKRPSAIKFACPFKPKEQLHEPQELSNQTSRSPRPSKKRNGSSHGSPFSRGNTQSPKKGIDPREPSERLPTLSKESRRSEALRFHEFASKHIEDDEWIHERPKRQSRLTVNDTLRKENEIRRLGEEAEAEALEEEDEEEYDMFGQNYVTDADDDQYGSENDDDSNGVSDGGNETDDEEGFAASDNESEHGSDYQFWTPAVAPAIDQLGDMRLKRRTISQSSIESVIQDENNAGREILHKKRIACTRRKAKLRMRPGTPELPDSTDFVCGTLDEDRPLEAAYLSCLEQRKKAKRCLIPQDVDPSFPTSDPEQEQSDDIDDTVGGNEKISWTTGQFDETGGIDQRGRQHSKVNRKSRSPTMSPKRLNSPAHRRPQSPAPTVNRSPCPRRLFGPSTRHMRSPPPRIPVSPPSSRRPSYENKNVAITYLAQRPHLTHTKSLPRTPNPFWQQHRHARGIAVEFELMPEDKVRSRGPIDIVQGLERKRQRRKEKFWLTHCRKDAKEKDRRRQPGKGAERMREVGLEMADRCKGYGHRVPLVLSV